MNHCKRFPLFTCAMACSFVLGFGACASDLACEQLKGRNFQSALLLDCGQSPAGKFFLCPHILRFQKTGAYTYGYGKVIATGNYTCKNGRVNTNGPGPATDQTQHYGEYNEILHTIVFDGVQFNDLSEEESKNGVVTETKEVTGP